MKYTLDTNLYIGSFRDPAERAALAEFEIAYTPMLYLTSIVAHELGPSWRHCGVQPSPPAS